MWALTNQMWITSSSPDLLGEEAKATIHTISQGNTGWWIWCHYLCFPPAMSGGGGGGGGGGEGGGGVCVCVCVWGGGIKWSWQRKTLAKVLNVQTKKMVNFQSKYENIVFSSYLCHPWNSLHPAAVVPVSSVLWFPLCIWMFGRHHLTYLLVYRHEECSENMEANSTHWLEDLVGKNSMYIHTVWGIGGQGSSPDIE